MICIVGGTGRLGRLLVPLLAPHEQVRVLTRDPSRVTGSLAQVVSGDVRDPAAIAAAVRGCSTVISAAHGFLGGRGAGPEAVDRDANARLIRSAADHGVERFVLLSVMDAAPDHPLILHRMKFAAEQSLRRSALAWTVIRPSAYLETWVEVLGGKLAAGGPALVFGRGRNPVNFVSVRDVAAVIAASLVDPSLVGATVDVGGPDNLTLFRFAQQLAASHGNPDRVKRIPRAALRLMSVLARPAAPHLARQAAAALAMDTVDMTFDNSAVRERFPGVDWHCLTDVLDDGVRLLGAPGSS